MTKETFNYRGSEFQKVYFSDIEDDLIDFGFNSDELFELMADENECVYVSNGFLRGLKNQPEIGEWHHYFKRNDEGDFDAFKLNFDIN